MEKVQLFGFILLGVSTIICAAYGLYQFLEADIPLIIRIGVVGILAGIVCLLLSVIKERLGEVK
ncbi:MAG: hypothetical protein QMD78_00635 [Methanocellales archaeon]|nr:hypothetical protein [Methanocellales archaeon]